MRKVIKKGARGGVTRYRCTGCGKSVSSARRPTRRLKNLWHAFVRNKQTKEQSAKEIEHTARTITAHLDAVTLSEKTHHPRPAVAAIDATYFGRGYGTLVARDPNAHENLHVHEIASETKAEYQKVRDDLEAKGYALRAVVLDGRRGIPSVFKGIPVQICHFHQWQIVKKKLTARPKLESHQALLSIGRRIARSTEAEMRVLLETFEKRYRNDLQEKTYILGTKRWRYTHAKLRSAYGSLLRNLPNLYTYQTYPQLAIPNTTNSLDGSCNALKSHVNVHRGLRRDRRFKVIRYYLGL